MLQRMSIEEMERDQREWRQEEAKREPWLANLRAASVDQHDAGAVAYRGRVYLIPAIPYAQGQQIEALDRHIARCTRELDELEEKGRTSFEDPAVRYLSTERARTYETLAHLYWTLVRPARWRDRLGWRWLRNPFLEATEGEIEDLAHFFRRARTTSRVRMLQSIRAPRYLRSTWPPTSMPLSLSTQPAQRRTGLPRAAGNTSPAAARS